ncbi:MAG: exodeoxyribonuclease VII small subunit [Candidatus Coatesbacteria bacterium]|nr:exodeoxyribonuclease VII small subunit [Candidatus Coatesbacteria bacterium]
MSEEQQTPDLSQTSFEEALERLENVVAELEKGGYPLNKLISLFEEGSRLARHCQSRLDSTERRLAELVDTADGTAERPLD